MYFSRALITSRGSLRPTDPGAHVDTCVHKKKENEPEQSLETRSRNLTASLADGLFGRFGCLFQGLRAERDVHDGSLLERQSFSVRHAHGVDQYGRVL